MVMFFAPLRVFGPLALLLFLASVATGVYHFFVHERHTLQEMDIILFVAGAAVLTIGMLAELTVRQRSPSERELRYWRRVYHEDDDSQ
jgi:hypothetical protein